MTSNVSLHSPDLVLRTAQDHFVVSPQEETRLWVKNAEGSFERLCNTRVSLRTASLKSGQVRVGRACLLPSGAQTWREGLGAHRPFPFLFLFLQPVGRHGDAKQGWHLAQPTDTRCVSPWDAWSRAGSHSRQNSGVPEHGSPACSRPSADSFSSTTGAARQRRRRNSTASQASVVSPTWATHAS